MAAPKKEEEKQPVNKALVAQENPDEPTTQNEDGEVAEVKDLRSVHGTDRGFSPPADIPDTDESIAATDTRSYPGEGGSVPYETIDINGIARGVDEPVAKEFAKKSSKK